MFDILDFSIYHSDRVKVKLAKIKLKYPHAKLLVYRTNINDMVVRARQLAFTKMFWLLDVEAELSDEFNLDWVPNEYDYQYIHIWPTDGGKIFEQGLSLWPKNLKITAEEISARIFPLKTMDQIVTKIYPFDIFVFTDIINDRINRKFDLIKNQYPNARLLCSEQEILDKITQAKMLSTTKMFWFFNIEYSTDKDLLWRPDIWDYNYIHIWSKNDELNYDQSLYLWPVDRHIDEIELENKSFNNVKIFKEDDTKASYDLIFFTKITTSRINLIFNNWLTLYPNSKLITSYSNIVDLISQAQQLATTKMFWLLDIDFELVDNFDLYWMPYPWDQRYVHVWNDRIDRSITQCLSLWPSDIQQDVTDGYSVTNLKRIENYVVNIRPFNIFVYSYIDNDRIRRRFSKIKKRYKNAQLLIVSNLSIKDIVILAQSSSTTKMFWLFDINHDINKQFDIKWEPVEWEQKWVYLWPGLDSAFILHGLSLWPTELIIDMKDDYTVNNIKIVNNNCINLVPYELFVYSYNKFDDRIDSRVNTLKVYFPSINLVHVDNQNIMSAVLKAQSITTTNMFWLLDIEADLIFNLDGRPEPWEQKWIHAWESTSGKIVEEGLSLWPSDNEYSLDGYDNVKFINEVATEYKPYDVFFISFNEPNAETNFKKLLTICPRSKRVDGIIGIHNAHKKCAKLSTTEMFWTVDADTILDPSFDLSYRPPIYDRKYLHLWYTKNPVNNLTYGYGAIKLWPRYAPLSHEGNWLDFTTSVGNIKIIDKIVATTEFNSSNYDSWRSGFREVVKLCYNLTTEYTEESISRLLVWLNTTNNVNYAIDAKNGARCGLDYFRYFGNDKDALKCINDFKWLNIRYKYASNYSTDIPDNITKEDLHYLIGIDV